MPKSEMIEDFSAPRAGDEKAREATVHAMPGAEAPVSTPVEYALLDPIAMLGRPNYLGTRQEIQTELDVIALAIRAFHRKQPDQAMREIAAFSARLTELAVLLHRVESTDRQYTRIRTQQVERFLAELDRQYKIQSRLVEVMRQDLELSR